MLITKVSRINLSNQSWCTSRPRKPSARPTKVSVPVASSARRPRQRAVGERADAGADARGTLRVPPCPFPGRSQPAAPSPQPARGQKCSQETTCCGAADEGARPQRASPRVPPRVSRARSLLSIAVEGGGLSPRAAVLAAHVYYFYVLLLLLLVLLLVLVLVPLLVLLLLVVVVVIILFVALSSRASLSGLHRVSSRVRVGCRPPHDRARIINIHMNVHIDNHKNEA